MTGKERRSVLENNVLPIASYRDKIIATIRDNPVTIITAETGRGKSTQVPQYLLAEGMDIVVTQPRRLAARTVAARVASELGEKLGQTIGVRTRDDRVVSKATRCLFATDGLALVRELMGAGRHSVLVLDEVHEWNLNIETLIAWSKHQLAHGATFKVVIMSATLEAEKLSAYFNNAPVIAVPGRSFPVEEQRAGYDVAADAIALLRQARNVLIFQPGKKEIAETIQQLRDSGVSAEILPLHGELTPEEQQCCFQRYARPKCIVATNVAQTSVTIADIDAVVDSGMERRTELKSGVEGLYLLPISEADSQQRKGRAGRTKSGIYINHYQGDRPAFPKAEILRMRLDQTVLRLAEAGVDAEELEFFHQPDRDAIHEAKRALKALDCMDDDGNVTEKGSKVAMMPISVANACMVLAADTLDVVGDVVTIAAILEIGELNARICTPHQQTTLRECSCWRQLCGNEGESDILAQLQIFNAAWDMRPNTMREHGINSKRVFQVRDVRSHLARSLAGKVRTLESTGDRENILRAVCAGMVDHLYRFDETIYAYVNGDDTPRNINRKSVVSGGAWLVGLPWDLTVPTRYGEQTLRLIRMVTRIKPEWLIEAAPKLVQVRTGMNPTYDHGAGVVSTTETIFNGQVVKTEEVEDPNHPEAHRLEGTYKDEAAWTDWVWNTAPAIEVPDLSHADAVLPDITEKCYGTSAVDGSPLIAYGAVVLADIFLSKPSFQGKWYRDREEGLANRRIASVKLDELCGFSQEEQKLASARAEASGLQSRIKTIMRSKAWNTIPHELRVKLGHWSDGWIPDSHDKALGMVQAMKQHLADADTAIQHASAKRTTKASPAEVSNAISALAAKFGKSA